MLVTNTNKVILHMPRCGGSSIRWAIMRAGYKYKFSCEHAPIFLLPEIYRKWPRIAFIRNPVDWYISLYYYNKYKRFHGGTPSIFTSVLSNDFTYDIDTFIFNSMDLKKYFSNKNNLNRLKKRICFVCMNKYMCWHNFTWSDVENIKASDFHGTLFDYKYTLIGLDTAKVYTIEDGIQNALDKEFCDTKHIVNIKYKNATPYKYKNTLPSRKSYEMIYEHDKMYFDMFNYKI